MSPPGPRGCPGAGLAVRARGCGVSAATSRALLGSSPAPCGDTDPVPEAADPGVMHGHLSPTTLIFLRSKSLTMGRAWERSPRCSVLRGSGTPSCHGGMLCWACPGARDCMAPPGRGGCSRGCCQLSGTAPAVACAARPSPASRRASRAGTQPGKVTRCQHPGTPCHRGRALGRGSLPAPPCKRLPISRRH